MKKVFFLTLILVSALFAQDDVIVWGSWTRTFDSTRVTLTNSDTAWLWVGAPNQFDYANNTSWPAIATGTTATKPTNLKIPYNGESFFNGNFYVGVYPTFASGACDSLQVRFYPYDNNGTVFTNDVRYLDFSDGTASTSPKWKTGATTGSALGASSNGEAVPVPGFMFMIIQKAASCTNSLSFKIFKN